MPFDRLPGANLNFSPLSQIHFAINPGKPIFPTYAVVMEALNHLLPALDPAERERRKMAQLQMAHQQQQLADYPAEHALHMKSLETQLSSQQTNEDLKKQQIARNALALKSASDHQSFINRSFGELGDSNATTGTAPSTLATPSFNTLDGADLVGLY